MQMILTTFTIFQQSFMHLYQAYTHFFYFNMSEMSYFQLIKPNQNRIDSDSLNLQRVRRIVTGVVIWILRRLYEGFVTLHSFRWNKIRDVFLTCRSLVTQQTALKYGKLLLYSKSGNAYNRLGCLGFI